MAKSLVQGSDIHSVRRTGSSYLDREKAKLQKYMQQGIARGVVPEEDAARFYEENDSTWPEKILGFEPTGSTLQAVCDILMIPNYLSASLAKARTEAIMDVDEDDSMWDKLTAYTIGMSPQSFKESFQARTTYGDILGSSGDLKDASTWGGLALDIALDPTTYLTFGVGARVKVGDRMLTRWGARIHRQAVKELLPEITERVAKDNAASKAKSVWGDQRVFEEVHKEAGKIMQEQYERLAHEAIKEDKKIFGKSTGYIPDAEAMFQDSANFLRKERGLWTTGRIERQLSKVTAKWKPADDFFRIFNQTWGMPEDAKNAWIAARDSISHQTNVARQEIRKAFSDNPLTEAERKHITHWLESQVSDPAARNATAGIVPERLSDAQMKIVDFVKERFERISKLEQMVGIGGDKIEDYVTHFMNRNVIPESVFMESMKEEFRTAGNQFAKHRVVAKISDLESFYGKGAVETDIMNILYRREKASIEMVNKKLFHDEMKAKLGTPAWLIEKSKFGLAHPFRVWLAKNRDKRIISELDQIWSDPDINISQLGFKERNVRHNREHLKWFSDPQRDMSIANDHMRMIGTISPTVRFTSKGREFEINVHELFDHLLEGAPHEKLTSNEIKTVLKRYDSRLRTNGIAPLLALVPDLHGALKTKLTDSALEKLIKELNRPWTRKLAAQLPEEMILQAKRIRREIGIITDDVKPLQAVTDLATNRLRKMGFNQGEMRQLIGHMFDKDELSKLSAREMDILNDYLAPNVLDTPKGEWRSVVTNESLVKVTFAKNKKTLDATNFKDTLKEIDGNLSVLGDSVNEFQKKLVDVDRAFRAAPRNERAILAQRRQQLIENIEKANKGIKLQNLRKKIAHEQGRILKGQGSKKNLRRLSDEAEKFAKKENIKLDPIEIKPRVTPDTTTFAKNYDELVMQVGPKGKAHWFYEGSEWYLPRSVAMLIQDVDKKLYAHELSYLMRGYDFVQNIFKAPIMAPFPEFHKRNGLTNILLTHLRAGMSMLNIPMQHNFLKTMTYILAKQGIDIDPKKIGIGLTAPGIALGAIAGGGLGTIPGAVAGGAIGAGIGKALGKSPAKAAALGATVGGLGASDDPVGALKGSMIGAVAGGAVGTGVGLTVKQAAKHHTLAPVVPGAVLGGMAGATGEDLEDIMYGASIGALSGGVYGKASLPKNLEKLGKQKLFKPHGWDRKITVEELVAEAGKRGVFTTRIKEEILETGLRKDVLFMRELFRVGELASDIPTRLNLFMTMAEKTGSLHEAAKAVKTYHFDYAALSNIERRVMRRAVPFYTWVKHALTISYDSILKHPGRVSGQFKFVRAQQNYEDVDPGDVPDWLRDRLSVISVNKQGEIEASRGAMSLSGIVFEDAIDIWKTLDPLKIISGDLEGIDRIFSRGPFLGTSMAEAAINKDFFFQRAIRHSDNYDSEFGSAYPWRDAPDWLKQAVGYRKLPNGKDSVDPQMAWLMGEVPYSRFISIIKNIDRTEEGDLNYMSLARQVLGEKIYKSDSNGKYYEDKARLEKMAIFLKKYRLISSYHVAAPAFEQSRRKKYTRTTI